MTTMKELALVGAVLALVAAEVWLARKRERAPLQIELHVPAGYRGVIVLTVDPRVPSPTLKPSGERVYEVPESGILAIPTADPFQEWHSISARYSDGAPLPVSTINPVPSTDEEVKLRPIVSTSDRLYYLVGTSEELAEALKDRGNLRPGPVSVQR
jgi:hypothetical protein